MHNLSARKTQRVPVSDNPTSTTPQHNTNAPQTQNHLTPNYREHVNSTTPPHPTTITAIIGAG
ncbi:hypothetical protein, partial [Dermatophilus congolensis]